METLYLERLSERDSCEKLGKMPDLVRHCYQLQLSMLSIGNDGANAAESHEGRSASLAMNTGSEEQ